MRVGYVTEYDADDLAAWSGIGSNMSRALAGEGVEICHVGPLDRHRSLRVLAGQVRNRLRGRRAFRVERDPALARSYARQAAERLVGAGVDIAVSPGTIPIAYLDFDGPLVVWTDATFGDLVDFYPEYTGLERRSIRNGHAMEREALARCAAAVYSSHWAARSAVERYGADPTRVHVIPFGANIVGPPDEAVERAIVLRGADPCRLLFVAGDWERKGGPLAVEAAAELERMGVRTELTAIGGLPEGTDGLPGFVRHLGFIDKRSTAGMERLTREFLRAHFSILPTLADCTPVALVEGYAFGVPAVARDVGGVGSVVADGVTGALLPAGADPAAFALAVARLMGNTSAYRRMARAALAEHRGRLNWDASGRQAVALLRSLVSREAHP